MFSVLNFLCIWSGCLFIFSGGSSFKINLISYSISLNTLFRFEIQFLLITSLSLNDDGDNETFIDMVLLLILISSKDFNDIISFFFIGSNTFFNASLTVFFISIIYLVNLSN